MRYAHGWLFLGLMIGALLVGGPVLDAQAQRTSSRERTTGPTTRSERGADRKSGAKQHRHRKRGPEHRKGRPNARRHNRHHNGRKHRVQKHRGQKRGRAQYRGPKHSRPAHRSRHRGPKHRGRTYQPSWRFGAPAPHHRPTRRHRGHHWFQKQATFGWYRDRRQRAVNVDVYVEYRPVIQRRTARYLVIDLYVELIHLGGGRHHYGRLHHLPSGLRRMRAIVYRDGPVIYDRGLHLMQGASGHFELVATVRAEEGRRYGSYGGRPTAYGSIDWEREAVHRYGEPHRRGYASERIIDLTPDQRALLEDLRAVSEW